MNSNDRMQRSKNVISENAVIHAILHHPRHKMHQTSEATRQHINSFASALLALPFNHRKHAERKIQMNAGTTGDHRMGICHRHFHEEKGCQMDFVEQIRVVQETARNLATGCGTIDGLD